MNTKEWDAAESVRGAWLAVFLVRKTTPKAARAVIAAMPADDGGAATD